MSHKSTIIYDQECPACMRLIKKMQQKDQNFHFDYLPKQAPHLLKLFPKLGEKEYSFGLRLIKGDKIFVGADALSEISKTLPSYKILARFYLIPAMPFLIKKMGIVFAKFLERKTT